MEIMDYMWLGVIIVMGLVEAAVPQLVSIWFVPGGIAGLIASLCGASLWVQILLFLVVSALALVLTRPFVKKIQSKKKEATNADMVLGCKALVTETINNVTATGRVSVRGNSWAARTEDFVQTVPEGSLVQVERIEGVKLIVIPVK